MTQNMFTEGLYQVFFRDRPLLRPETENPTPEQLKDARITRWFRTIVNTRLLVIGYVATGGLAIHVQRKPNRVKVSMLMGFNIFSLLLGLFSILTYSLHIAKENIPLSTGQRVGAYVAKGGSVFFMVVCLLASVYTLFLTWRGLYHYSAPYRNTYSPLPQGGEEQSDLLLDTENREFSL
ncbi:uncharacterized protein si:dkey-30c15.13 isoform X2 [Anguilla rostrata]